MAIRIRKKGGETETLDDASQFVEVTDIDGKVGLVFYTSYTGGIGCIRANTKEAKKYKELYNVDFCPVVNVNL